MVRAGCLGAVLGGPLAAIASYYGYILIAKPPAGCMAGLEAFRILPVMFVSGLVGMLLGAFAANLLSAYLSHARRRRNVGEEEDYSPYL